MSSRGVNKAIVELYLANNSIPQVSKKTGIPLSTVRHHLKKAGVLRSRSEGVRLAAAQGRLSHTKGCSRTFGPEWCANISKGKRAAADKTAVGWSLKPNGYIEATRGPNKGRGQHRIVMEKLLGRTLLPSEHVHHIDGNRSNNAAENLVVLSASEHIRLHALEAHPLRERDSKGRYL